jgi:hypothetical protein
MTMTNDLIRPEGDVLVAATVFLVQRGLVPYQFSIAAGRGLDSTDTINRLRSAFASIGRSYPNFSGNGADILAVSESEWWAVECKGCGAGQPQTQRNNFDRALASVVSYFTDKPEGLPTHFSNVTVFLALALPATRAYLKELKRRVRIPLRKHLNLWVLLYEPDSKAVRAVSPEEEI